MRVFRSRLFSACVAGVVTAMVVGGIAWAQIPDTNGVITGCYNNKSGALRVIDTSKTTCVAKTETQLTWNQKGVAGAPGAQGATGANGSNGAPGSSGFVSVTPLDRIPFGTVLTSPFQMIDAPGTPVTVAAGQKLIISLTVPLRSTAGANGLIFLCDDAVPGFESLSSIEQLNVTAGAPTSLHALSGASTSIVGSATPGDFPISAGTYHVGVCVNGSGLVDSGGFEETGFVTVVNSL